MKSALFNRAQADRGARLAGVGFSDRLVPRQPEAFPVVVSSQGRDTAAGVKNPLAPAAFSTESCPVLLPDGQATAPAAAPPAAGAGILSEASAFILSLIAAHEGRSERDVLAQMIAAAGMAIGLSALLMRDADDIEDLSEVPGYASAAANRFRGGT